MEMHGNETGTKSQLKSPQNFWNKCSALIFIFNLSCLSGFKRGQLDVNIDLVTNCLTEGSDRLAARKPLILIFQNMNCSKITQSSKGKENLFSD